MSRSSGTAGMPDVPAGGRFHDHGPERECTRRDSTDVYQFQGEFEHTLDDKNRVVLPAALRKNLSPAVLEKGFTLVIGRRSQYLELYPKEDWNARIERQRAMYDEYDEEAEEYFRDILSSAFDVIPDKQYRFVLPEARKKDAGIDKDIVFIGMWDRIEIWDRTRWEERRRSRKGKQAPPPPRRRPQEPEGGASESA